MQRNGFLFLLVIFVVGRSVAGQEPTTSFQAFAQRQALKIRSSDRDPSTREEWNRRKARLREDLTRAFGGFPASDCNLEAKVLGVFQRDGYRVERIIFQTRPGIWMTANAYVPDRPGKLPAILHVHGHWSGAKQDPVVQSRCIGCAKLGFFVLCVDAFGAGERGINRKLGEYHGEMTAATLLPVGLPLAGLQIYENKRAVDYLISRPEVDSQRIGITGASGGGNQTMYAGAMDDRLKCIVPTCSVGTYQAYLSAACCLCELVPGGLKITEEGDILGLAAERGLMVTSATKDAFQFSVGEATKSVARAEVIAGLFPGVRIRHTIIESPHAYNQPMREAMYGWMALNLRGEGDGSPIPDPEILPEDPEMLRCYPGDSRPDGFVTIPQFAGEEARKLLGSSPSSFDHENWKNERLTRQQKLIASLGGMPEPSPLKIQSELDESQAIQTLTFQTEADLLMTVRRDLPRKSGKIAIALDLDGGAEAAWSSELSKKLRGKGWSVVAPELRATGKYAIAHDTIANAKDHNSAEWAIWIGRPLLGQWVVDVRRTLDAIAEVDGVLPDEIMAVGSGSAGIVALCSAALDERITAAQSIASLASYVTDQPYRGVRLGLMVPGILREFGDISMMAALVAPRKVTISGGKSGNGDSLDIPALSTQFDATRRTFEALGQPASLSIEAAE